MLTAPTTPDPDVQGIIPVLYRNKYLQDYWTKAMVGEITNRDVKGDKITSTGNKVVVAQTPKVNIYDHTEGQDLHYEDLESTPVEFTIERDKAYSFVVNDKTKYQSHLNIEDNGIYAAANQMRIAIDRDFFCDIPSQVHQCNQGTTAGKIGIYNMGDVNGISVTDDNALSLINDARSILNEQNVEETVDKDNDSLTGFWMVAPEWFCNTLLSTATLQDASAMGDPTSVTRTHAVGKLHGMTIYRSNNVRTDIVSTNRVANIMFGHKNAITYVSQLVDDETLPSPHSFGTLYRGRQVFDWFVEKPEGIGLLRAYQG